MELQGYFFVFLGGMGGPLLHEPVKLIGWRDGKLIAARWGSGKQVFCDAWTKVCSESGNESSVPNRDSPGPGFCLDTSPTDEVYGRSGGNSRRFDGQT